MRAITFPRYGDHSQLNITDDVIRPVPAADEVLIRVAAAPLNRGDWHYVHGTPFPVRLMAGGLFTPKKNIPGGGVVGRVEMTGAAVETFKVGDRVLADMSESGFGGWAEYCTCKAVHTAHCDESLSDEIAATIPVAALTALQGLRDHACLQPGESLLVKGATGGVGMFAVLIGIALGAEVTAVGSSAKANWLSQLGAAHTLHHDQTDILSLAQQFDVIFDAAAYQDAFSMKPLLKTDGRYLLVGGRFRQFLKVALFGAMQSGPERHVFKSFLQKPVPEDMELIAGWIAQGTLQCPPPAVLKLEQASEAMAMMERRDLTGKLVLSVLPS